jgi:hypothetical protein
MAEQIRKGPNKQISLTWKLERRHNSGNASDSLIQRLVLGAYANFRKLEGVVGTGWSWLRIGTGGGHLWVR